MTNGDNESNANLPDSWTSVRLGDVSKSKGGFGFPIDKQGKKEGKYPFLKVSDMNLQGNEKFLRSSNNWIDASILKELKAKTFPASSIVFPKIGAALLTNKKRMLVRDSVIDNNVMAVVVNDENECLPEFLYQWFLTLDLGSIANAGTVPSLTAGRLQEVRLPLPPLPEQRKIASVLGLLQRAEEQQRRLIALTVELKKALLHELLTCGFSSEPQKQTEIGLVPQSWDVRPLGDYLTEAQYGISAKGSASGSYALLRMTNQRQGHISPENLQYVELSPVQFAKFRVERQDILFNRTNSLDLVGRTAIFDLDGDYIFASYLIRLRTNAALLRPFYLNHYFNWDETQTRLKTIASRAVSQSNISASRLRTFPVPVPSPDEQDEIVHNVDCLDRKLAVLHRRRAALVSLFHTLLYQLMTAQIRVHELDLPKLESVAAA